MKKFIEHTEEQTKYLLDITQINDGGSCGKCHMTMYYASTELCDSVDGDDDEHTKLISLIEQTINSKPDTNSSNH